jgi:alginate O-acetyltransferase complex protein AlgI
MLFPTFDFLLFVLVVLALVLPLYRHPELCKLLLLGASYFFYAQWNWRFCFLLAGSSVWSYVAGFALGQSRNTRLRRWVVGGAVAGHLMLLGTFKYFDFFVGSLNRLAHMLGLQHELPFVEIILPVGISFFTFHGISYVVDVYRGEVPVCRRLIDILLYLSFFPQLVAGPIVRASFFLPQLHRERPARLAVGPAMLLILGGFFKKVVIANYLATDLVDPVFFDPSSFTSLDLLLAVYGYAAQIYCDFSAYSDMAIGLAALLGYWFPANFDQPYRAQSLREFWRRWHISLSFWLRDYLYKPLGGSRGSMLFTARNLMATMLLGGIWHGAGWKFVFWGGLHGAGLTAERFLAPFAGSWSNTRWARAIATVLVFHFVCLGWIFFRADSFQSALIYLGALFQLRPGLSQITPFTLSLLALGMSLHFVPPGAVKRVTLALAAWPEWAVGAASGLALVATNALGPEGVAPFIYFQF